MFIHYRFVFPLLYGKYKPLCLPIKAKISVILFQRAALHKSLVQHSLRINLSDLYQHLCEVYSENLLSILSEAIWLLEIFPFNLQSEFK